MTADQYRTTLKRLGLSQASAARFLGVHGVTSRKWANGRARVPVGVDRLLCLMLGLHLTVDQARHWIGSAELPKG